MSDAPRFSVAMCTYNGEKYLREQLDSIAAQSVLPAELVVCDDGSTDGTVGILHDFAANAPFPVLITVNAENLGVARNFFKALRLCQMDWLLLCDQDDVWMKERIAIFSDIIQKNKHAKLILSDAVLVDEFLNSMKQTLFQAYRVTKRERRWINDGSAHRALVRHVFATGATMAVRRNFVNNIPEPQAGFLHDEWIAWLACPDLHLIEQPMLLYRQHGRQVTGIDGRISAQIERFHNPGTKSARAIEDAGQRFQILLLALAEANISTPAVKAILREKIRFLDKRAVLSSHFLPRLLDIVRSNRLPAYWRYASGWRTVIKDIVGLKRL